MTSAILSVVVGVLVVALVVPLLVAARAIPDNIEPPAAPQEHPDTISALGDLRGDLQVERIRIDTLRLAVSDGIERVSRAEKRVAKTVQGARKLLREHGLEHPGLEAEAEEILPLDVEGSQPELVLEVPEAVEHDGSTGFPGISRSELENLRRGA